MILKSNKTKLLSVQLGKYFGLPLVENLEFKRFLSFLYSRLKSGDLGEGGGLLVLE